MDRNQFRLYLWLSEIKTRKTLIAALRVLAILVLLWTGIVTFSLVQIRESIIKQRDETDQVKNKADSLDAQVKLQYKAAQRRKQIIMAKDIYDSSEVADFVNNMAALSKIQVRGIRFGGSHDNQQKANQSTQDNTNTSSSDSFDCELFGKFPSLLKMMDSMATSPLAVEINSIQISKAQIDPRTQEANVSMHITGRLQR